jgi:ketosteroid isomerase-like protein
MITARGVDVGDRERGGAQVSNTPAVQEIYEAFGRGDVPRILGRLADDVAWEQGGSDYGVPWLIPGRGKAHAASFFERLAAIEITKFVPKNLLEGGNQVAAVIHIEFLVKGTGVAVVDEELHLWTFGPDGKVTAFRHVVDTAKHVAANRGQAVA